MTATCTDGRVSKTLSLSRVGVRKSASAGPSGLIVMKERVCFWGCDLLAGWGNDPTTYRRGAASTASPPREPHLERRSGHRTDYSDGV